MQPSQSLAITAVAGQVPGVAAVRAVPSGSTAAISVSGSGWSPNLAVGQLTADVCSVGGVDCSPVGAFATGLSTDAFGSLVGSLSIPAGETSTTGARLLRVYEPGGSASAQLLVLGTPVISVSPTSALVGDTVSVVGANFDPQRTVAVFTCTAYPGPCGLEGPDSTTTALVGGQFSISGIDVGGSQTRAIGAQQDNGGPPVGWPRATTPLSVLDPSTTTTVSVPADVSWPADGVAATVAVTGLPDGSTGEVTVTAYGPDDPTCSTAVGSATAFLDPPASGSSAAVVDLGLAGTGVYRWVASYSGSAPSSTSACGAPGTVTTVAALQGQLDASVDAGQIELGSESTPLATLSGLDASARGYVSFALYAGTTCSGLPLVNRSVAVAGADVYGPSGFAPAATGAYVWRMTYSGDANHASLTVCDTTNAKIDVVSAPGAATNVVTGPVVFEGNEVNGQFQVTWNTASAGGGLPLTAAVIRFYYPGSNDLWFTDFRIGGEGPYALAGFAPGESYEVTVALQNAVGESPESPRQLVTPNRTPLPPVITAFEPAGSRALQVRWTAGANEFPGQTYRLELQPGGLVADVPGGAGELQYTFTGLDNGTAYDVSVVAVPPPTSIVGLASSDPATAGPVSVIGVPDPPTGVSATALVGSVRIAWTAPTDTGGSPLIRFGVRNVTTGQTLPRAATATAYTWPSLSPSIAYTFEVWAENAQGESARVTVGPVTPASGPPSAPDTIQASLTDPPLVVSGRLTQRAVVSWSAPEANGGVITQYRVEAYDAATQTFVKAVTCTTTTNPDCFAARSVAVAGLANGVPHVFRVRVTSSASSTKPFSAYSNAVTPAQAPLAPVLPTGAVTPWNEALTVVWNPPTNDGGSVVTAYRVAVRTTPAPGTEICVQWVSAADPRSAAFRGTPDGNCPSIENGSGYRIEVRAINAVGEGANATSARATPSSSRPPLP